MFSYAFNKDILNDVSGVFRFKEKFTCVTRVSLA